MSCEKEKIVSVEGLVVKVRGEGKTGKGTGFLIDYGTFDVCTGDFVLVRGRNGSGKSTFLRLFRPQSEDYFEVTEGSIRFLEEGFPDKSLDKIHAPNELARLNSRTSFIGQEDKFQSGASAYSAIVDAYKDACAFAPPGQKSRSRKELDECIREYFDKYLVRSLQCDYKTFQRKAVRKWSGGQQKMINVLAGVIKAKICGLKLVVMDEPLNNLDGINKDIVNALVRELMESNVAIVAITHCQIFSGVNKVLDLIEQKDGFRKATFTKESVPPHAECLEPFH